MGADKKGNVAMAQFVDYFDLTLPMTEKEFDDNIKQFLVCARSLSVSKRKDEEAKKASEANKAKDGAKVKLSPIKAADAAKAAEAESAEFRAKRIAEKEAAAATKAAE